MGEKGREAVVTAREWPRLKKKRQRIWIVRPPCGAQENLVDGQAPEHQSDRQVPSHKGKSPSLDSGCPLLAFPWAFLAWTGQAAFVFDCNLVTGVPMEDERVYGVVCVCDGD